MVELSNDIELVDARTREARNVLPDSLGLYRRFQTISLSYRPTMKTHTIICMFPGAQPKPPARFLNGGTVNSSCEEERFVTR